MKPSRKDEVRDMYEATADDYAKMMDKEIDLPVYTDVLGRLKDRLANLAGPLLDTACGSGHMLAMYRDRFDASRPLLGQDLSPAMVAIAAKRLRVGGEVVAGDMCDLSSFQTESAAALMNFFAIHHLGRDDVPSALAEWHRVLQPGGQIVVAAWEGEGLIDYGDQADIVAFRYNAEELEAWARAAGFEISRCEVEPVEDFPMDAVYLEGSK